MDRKQIVALILGCNPRELMGYKDYGAFVAVLDPQGRKFVYTNEHLAEVAKVPEAPKAPKVPKAAKKTVTGGQPGSKSVAKPNIRKLSKSMKPVR